MHSMVLSITSVLDGAGGEAARCCFSGHESPLGAFNNHRRFPFLALRRRPPAPSRHCHPIGRMECGGCPRAFPEIDADERTPIACYSVIFTAQSGAPPVGLARRG